MRYIGISVVLVLLSIMCCIGCSGTPDNTGIPVYSLPGNTDIPQAQVPTGPRLNAIIIEPEAVNIEDQGSQIYKAYGYYSDSAIIDITGVVTWYSTNESVGYLTDKGVFHALGTGYAGVGAYFQQSPDNIVYASYSFANVFSRDEYPPEPVRNVNATILGNEAFISWSYSPEANIMGYNVYRTRTSGEGYDKDEPLNEDIIILNHFTDINPGGGILYYVVAAVTEDDVIGVFSHEAELDFNPEDPWDE